MTLKIIFMGTPDFAVPTLQALHDAGHNIVACYTRAPQPAGRRGLNSVSSPVQQAAETLGIPTKHPISLQSTDVQKDFCDLSCDIAIIVAYGLLLPPQILQSPKHGCLNGHASLLPRWRGAAPIARAIMSGDTKSGISIMSMDEGLDTGPYAFMESVDIHPTTDAQKLNNDLSQLCATSMVRALTLLEQGELTFTPQSSEGVCYAEKVKKSETRIDWTQSATIVHRHIMGLSSSMGAWCELPQGERLKILESQVVESSALESGTLVSEALVSPDDFIVACGDGSIRALQVQKAGGKKMTGSQFLIGQRDLTRVI